VSVKPETSENAGVHRWLHRFKPTTSSELGRDIDSDQQAQDRGIQSEWGLECFTDSGYC